MMKNDLKLNTWYKWINHYNVPNGLKYIKIIDIEEDTQKAYYNERINVSGKYIKRRSYVDGLNGWVEIPISEIERCLPEGHPDSKRIKQLFPIY